MAELIKATSATTSEADLPTKIAVKNISKASVYLTYGEIKPGESGECSKAEFENFVGTYLEKV